MHTQSCASWMKGNLGKPPYGHLYFRLERWMDGWMVCLFVHSFVRSTSPYIFCLELERIICGPENQYRVLGCEWSLTLQVLLSVIQITEKLIPDSIWGPHSPLTKEPSPVPDIFIKLSNLLLNINLIWCWSDLLNYP